MARNGPEFESITKRKQQGNPKFEFLYGGEDYQYYKYRVAMEQASNYFSDKSQNKNTPTKIFFF